MCDIPLLAGIALTAASVGANTYAQSQVSDKRNDAINAERIRQAGYNTKVAALNTQSQNRYQDFAGQQSQKAGDLTSFFKQNQVPTVDDPNKVPPIDSSSNTVVQQEQAKQTGKAQAYTNQQAGALGTLRSFGDVLGEISRSQARDAGAIAQLGNFKQGSSSVLPYQLDAANLAGGNARMLGDVLGGFGSIGINKGLQGSYVTPSMGTTSPISPTLLKTSTYGPPMPLNPAQTSVLRNY